MWQRVVARSVVPMRVSFEAFLAKTGRTSAVGIDALFDVMLGALFTRALNQGAEDAESFAHAVALVVTTTLQAPEPGKRGRRS
jgi:hypothetical protein